MLYNISASQSSADRTRSPLAKSALHMAPRVSRTWDASSRAYSYARHNAPRQYVLTVIHSGTLRSINESPSHEYLNAVVIWIASRVAVDLGYVLARAKSAHEHRLHHLWMGNAYRASRDGIRTACEGHEKWEEHALFSMEHRCVNVCLQVRQLTHQGLLQGGDASEP